MFKHTIPSIFPLIAPNVTWKVKTNDKVLYLTFDDGPHPSITPLVLNILDEFNAKATFFCSGKNAQAHPEICREIIAQGHQIGNHTQLHLNGWKTLSRNYINDVEACKKTLETILNEEVKLFRPPYGKIGWKAYFKLKKQGYTIVMWDVLSADFDSQTNAEHCLANVLNNIESGSIVVFHDSQKCYAKLRKVLPKTLAFLHENKFCCEVIA